MGIIEFTEKYGKKNDFKTSGFYKYFLKPLQDAQKKGLIIKGRNDYKDKV